MCFTLDGDEGDGAYVVVGLGWLCSTPHLFDDSTSKIARRHGGWFVFNHKGSATHTDQQEYSTVVH